MALYAKAVEITWKHPDKFQNTIIVRLGVFHTICTLLSTIGKRFQDAGLRDLCIESGVIAECSIAGVMGGRRYNRAVRLHKLVYEAFTRMAWKGFRSWLEATHADDVVHMDDTLRIIDNLCEDVSQASLKQVIDNSSCTCIMELFGVYIEFLRCGFGYLSAYVLWYKEPIAVCKINIRLLIISIKSKWPPKLNLNGLP